MKFEIIKVGIFNLQVCTDAKDEEFKELTREVNKKLPCGTINGWIMSKRQEVKPVPCELAEFNNCRHIIFDC